MCMVWMWVSRTECQFEERTYSRATARKMEQQRETERESERARHTADSEDTNMMTEMCDGVSEQSTASCCAVPTHSSEHHSVLPPHEVQCSVAEIKPGPLKALAVVNSWSWKNTAPCCCKQQCILNSRTAHRLIGMELPCL